MTTRQQEHSSGLPPKGPLPTKPGPTHPELVKALLQPGSAIHDAMTPLDAHLIHMVLGISGEAGELLDAVKKATIYRKPLDRANVIEELGDLEFYMEGLRAALDISREDTLDHNIKKLSIRYGKTYSNQAAIERADKQ